MSIDKLELWKVDMDKLEQHNWTAADHYRWLEQLKEDNPNIKITPKQLP